jgi:hypothetical protein
MDLTMEQLMVFLLLLVIIVKLIINKKADNGILKVLESRLKNMGKHLVRQESLET